MAPVAVVCAAAIAAGLWWVLRTREQWLVACLLLALAYISISLGLERPGTADWLQPIRWGVFGATLVAFVRFRWHHRFARSAEAAERADGPGDGPQEQ